MPAIAPPIARFTSSHPHPLIAVLESLSGIDIGGLSRWRVEAIWFAAMSRDVPLRRVSRQAFARVDDDHRSHGVRKCDALYASPKSIKGLAIEGERITLPDAHSI